MLVKRKVEHALESKGFQRTETHHAQSHYMTKSGQKTLAKTQTSHGRKKNKDIDDNLASSMARQCFLKLNEFKKLIDCSLSRCEYEEILRKLSKIRN